MLPSGNCGKQFIGELAKLFNAFAHESAHEAFAIKAAMTISPTHMRLNVGTSCNKFTSKPGKPGKPDAEQQTLTMLM